MSMGLSSTSDFLPKHSWWSTLTSSEKKLCIVCVALSALTAAFFISTIVLTVQLNKNKDEKRDICETDDCIQAAKQIKSFMDESKNPCDNFRSFACGNFANIHKNAKSRLRASNSVVQSQVKEILQNAEAKIEGAGARDEALHLYRKCMALENAEGLSSMTSLLKLILGTDLPMAAGQSWDEKEFDMLQSIARYTKLLDQNFAWPFQIYIYSSDTSRFVPYFLRPIGDLDVIINRLATGVELIKRTTCIVYPNCSNDALSSKDIEELHEFLSPIAQGYESNVTQIQKAFHFPLRSDEESKQYYREYEVKQLQNAFPEVNWLTYFRTLMGNNAINETFKIVTNLEDVERSVKELRTIGKRKFANLLGWSFISNWGKLFSAQIRKTLAPTVSAHDVCSTYMTQVMKFAVGRLYIDKHVPPAVINEVSQMSQSLQKAVQEHIIEADWLDISTKLSALKKLWKMNSSVGLPSWALDDGQLNNYYKLIKNVTEVDFVTAFISAKTNYFNREIDKLQIKVDRQNEWFELDPLEANAAYSTLLNGMRYQIGVIVKPFYLTGTPRAVRYGCFGFTAGHEITHGFDSKGRSRDENGMLNDWWSSDANQAFEEREKCFIELFSNITDDLTQLQLNGKGTVKENMADSAGLKAAFQAFKSSPSEAGQVLKGLEQYSEEQLFFISAAQNWCSDETKESLETSIKNGNHSPAKYRSLIPFKNEPEFAKAFACDQNSEMNPSTKCKLW